jgi:hypothetical protein
MSIVTDEFGINARSHFIKLGSAMRSFTEQHQAAISNTL